MDTATATLDAYLVPQKGPVSPKTCPLCADLKRAVEYLIDEGTVPEQFAALEAMELHGIFGHPDDERFSLGDAA
ncbi:hypothetical protein ACFYOA_08010 [Streptomyces iakyrus]|uniref:hypothetical protein n=1 Tax=Streptomyces iakyrus TaxID=68219 RepID=UPI0036B32354